MVKILGFPKPSDMVSISFHPEKFGKLVPVTMFVDLFDLSWSAELWLQNGSAEVAKSNTATVTLGIG